MADDDPGYDLQPIDINPFAAVPKAGQTVPPVNARPMTGQAAMSALGVPDIRTMTPEEQQMFALGAVPMLAAGPEARVAEEIAAEAAPAVARGIKAFHGSPYDFNAFDLSKIGTGEGAQAYGHGLYFAENPGVAETYVSGPRVTDMDWPIHGTQGNDFVVPGMQRNTVPAWVARTANTPQGLEEVLSNFRGRVEEAKTERPENVTGLQDIVTGLEAVKAGKAEFQKPGRRYEVSINADPEHFLDWDKPLSEQHPKVQQAMQPFVEDAKQEAYNRALASTSKQRADELWGMVKNPMNVQGQMFLDKMQSRLGGPEKVTEALHQAGIPGIKYLDQGSRGAGPGSVKQLTGLLENAKALAAQNPHNEGLRYDVEHLEQQVANAQKGQTSNYVVFDDKLIDIIKKYGMAGLVAGGASHFQTQPVDHQPEFEEGFAKGGAVKDYADGGLPTKKAPPQWNPPVVPDQWAQSLPLDTQRAIGRNALRDRMMQGMGIDPVYPFERHDDTATADEMERRNLFGGPATADQLRAYQQQMERDLYNAPGDSTIYEPQPIGIKTGGRVGGLATKAQANYRGGNYRHHCAICTMFVKPSSCTAVRGHISPRALCDFYEPKGNGERIVDNRYDVVTGANSSKKPTGPIFIDRHIPEWSPKLRTKSGKRVRLWTYLSIHEDDEQKHMEAGDSYDEAHKKATKAERKKAEADGVNWKAYTDEVDNYLARVEHERVGRKPPVPLHVKPEAALKGEGHHHSSHKGGKQ